MASYIITVPHSLCATSADHTDRTNRMCDERAEQAATLIRNNLLALGVTEAHTHLLLSNVIREQLDLNRIESFTGSWRQSLRDLVHKMLIEYPGYPIWVIDAHSFPQASPVGSHTSPIGSRASFTGSHVVILNNAASTPEAQWLYDRVHGHLLQHGVTINMLQGSQLNDIQREMSTVPLTGKQKIYNLLLEFNEDTAFFSDAQLQETCAYIAQTITSEHWMDIPRPIYCSKKYMERATCVIA